MLPPGWPPKPGPHACKIHLFLCFLPSSYCCVFLFSPWAPLLPLKSRTRKRGLREGLCRPMGGNGEPSRLWKREDGREDWKRERGPRHQSHWLCFSVRGLVLFLLIRVLLEVFSLLRPGRQLSAAPSRPSLIWLPVLTGLSSLGFTSLLNESLDQCLS